MESGQTSARRSGRIIGETVVAGLAWAGSDQTEAESWRVAALPALEKDRVITKLLANPEDRGVVAELWQRFHEAHRDDPSTTLESRRTVGALLGAAELSRAEREGTAARQAAAEKARRDRAAAAARARHLDRLAGQETRLWTDIDRLIATKLPKNYDQAVQHLIDLRDLAGRRSDPASAAFTGQLEAFRATHARKPSLLERVFEGHQFRPRCALAIRRNEQASFWNASSDITSERPAQVSTSNGP